MKTFILIPGAWMGAWAWGRVTQGLRALGHPSYPVTLTGLDRLDRDIADVGLDDHINDVLWLLKREDLRDVVLIGHDYGGIVAGAVADRAPDRVAHTVFVEGLLPRDGKSALDALPADMHAEEMRLIGANDGRWPVPDVTVVHDGQDLTVEQAEWLVDRFVGHPGRALSDPVIMQRPVSQQRATYIVCEKEHFGGGLRADIAALRDEPSWTFRSLDTGLWPMVSSPDALVTLLDEATDD